MSRSGRAWLRLLLRILFFVAIIPCGIWGGMALGYRAPSGWVGKLWICAWVAVHGFVGLLLWRDRIALAFLAMVLSYAVLMLWWSGLQPSNDRIWAADLAENLTGTIDDDRVTLNNVRNFEWRDKTDFTPRWETRHYQLDQLDSVDLILSYWDGGTAIAHMLVSFGFADGEHVAFSVEIRREQDEEFSELGGFFKQFELSIIAADERDVVRVRTNVRGEDDFLYRVQLSADDRRALFLAYIDEANALARTPRFYNTITANCTTLVFHMMKGIVGRLPLDYRLLLTGHLAEYVYKLGALDMRYSLAELTAMGHFTERAKAATNADDFSQRIRVGIPESPLP